MSLLEITPFTVATLDVGGDGAGGGGPSEGFQVVGYNVQEPAAGGNFQFLIPEDTEEDDQIWVFSGGRTGADLTGAVTNYTQAFYYDEGGNCRTQGYYRYAGAAEGGTTETWTKNNLRESVHCMLVVRGGVTSGDPLDVAIVKQSDYLAVMNFLPVTTVTNGCFLIGWYGKRWNGAFFLEDYDYPPGRTGILRRFEPMGESIGGLAVHQGGDAGLQAGVSWPTLPAGETNLGIQITIALKAG